LLDKDEINDFVNDDIARFSNRRKEDFSINLNVEPYNVEESKTIIHYPIVVFVSDKNEYRNITLSFDDIYFIFNRNKKIINIELPSKNYQMFFVALRQMATSVRTKYNKDILGTFYKRNNRLCNLEIRVMKNTKIISMTGEILNPFGGSFSTLDKKKVKSRNLRTQFFIFFNGTKSFFNIRLISLELNTPIENEQINDNSIIPYNDFMKLKMNDRIKYYGRYLNNFDENINNEKYGCIGIYLNNNEIYSCNNFDINYFLNNNISFLPNTYLLSNKTSLQKEETHYKDRQGFYHYFGVLMFDRKLHDNNTTIQNKINLYKVVKYYLSIRLIATLGLWYDQTTPPTSCIHFNIHIRSKLKLNYLYVLFNDWRINHGKPHLSHIFDPLMGRLYLARNNRMF
jgi:hypothetical protein